MPSFKSAPGTEPQSGGGWLQEWIAGQAGDGLGPVLFMLIVIALLFAAFRIHARFRRPRQLTTKLSERMPDIDRF